MPAQNGKRCDLLSHVFNAFRLEGFDAVGTEGQPHSISLFSPMTFGREGFDAHSCTREYEKEIKPDLQWPSAVWGLMPGATLSMSAPVYVSPMPFGCPNHQGIQRLNRPVVSNAFRL